MDLSIYPLPFFLSAIALIASGLFAWKHRKHGWGLPMGAVLATIAVWYLGGGLYNDYEEYQTVIGDAALGAAWWQVLLFIVTFSLLVLPVHRLVNQHLLKRQSRLFFYAKTGRISDPSMQRNIDQLAKALLICWLVIMAIALSRRGWDFGGMFFPYLEGYKINPWARGRVGGGISALLSLAGYLQLFLTAGFGVVAAIAKNPKTRMMAITVCFLAFPFYIFDRTRNPMIATMLPGLLAWVFLGLRAHIIVKGAILLAVFLLANFWMLAVVDTDMNRGVTVGNALKDIKVKQNEKVDVIDGVDGEKEDRKHKGLSMFAELGHMNNLFDNGLYKPTWGGRYFAEVVNFIPRALWKDKPLVGIDYALARGFGNEAGHAEYESGGGVTASIATGMIGQGMVNFGRFFGPMCSALLMSIWVAILARLDLRGDPGRLLLCVVGMILTFNIGRDITLFVLYPFVFGYMLLLGWEWQQKKKMEQNVTASRQRKRTFPAR